MAKEVIKFGRTDTGKTISDIIWDFCKTLSTGTTVQTSGSSLMELGYGEYILDNPHIAEETAFSVSLSGSPSTYFSGLFTHLVSGVDTVITSSGDINIIAGTTMSGGDYLNIQKYDNLIWEIAELSANPSLRVDLTFRIDPDHHLTKFTFQGRYQHNSSKSHQCDVYAYNYLSAAFEIVSTATNHLEDSDINYSREFPLDLRHIEPATGIVTIRIEHNPINFGNVNDRLYINKVFVTAMTTNTLDLHDLSIAMPPIIADAVWDEDLTGTAHNTNGTAGKILKTVGANVVYTGVTVSASENTITLDAGADSHNGAYDPSLIAVTTGTGAGQCRLILQYDGATRTAVVDRDWKILPVVGDAFVIFADAGREHVNEGLLRGASGADVQLNANASPINNAYNGQVIFFRSGTGEDQAFRVVAYDGTNKIATLCDTPGVAPDTTTAYVMLPGAILRADILAQGLLANGIASQATSDDLHDAQFGRTSYDHTTKKLTLFRVDGSILKRFTLVEDNITIQPVIDRIPE